MEGNEVIGHIKNRILYNGMIALNKTAAHLAMFSYPNIVQEVFDRPTPFIQRGFKYRKAAWDNLTAEVYADDYMGPAPQKTLASEVFGGARKPKRFELALRAKGILPADQFAVPGRDARLDAYGNMSNGQIVQILSALGAYAESGFIANKKTVHKSVGSRPNRKTDNIFVINTIGRKSTAFLNQESLSGLSNRLPGLPMGIYQRIGAHGLKQLMKFVKQPSYSKRFNFFQEGERIAFVVFNNEFNHAFDKYLNG